MELTVSMFESQAEYWRFRAELAERTVLETAQELGCEADNEVLCETIAALKKDAGRYRKLRDAGDVHVNGPAVFFDAYTPEELDAHIDNVAPNAEVTGRPLADGPA